MRTDSRARTTAAVLVLLALLVVAVAVFGAAGDYVVFDRPIQLGTVAVALVVGAGWCVFTTRLRRAAAAVVLVLGWMAGIVYIHFSSFGEYEHLPNPANTGVEAGLLLRNDFAGPHIWMIVMRGDEGLLTRERTLACVNTDSGGPPEMTWADSAHLRAGELVIAVDPATGRPTAPIDSPYPCDSPEISF
ncbi:hypothetical protein FHS43_000098 [Streptosporangium becharense]|uniref:Uncharacterized protein n=1 Tax=Streptosporangium becharense TaxID=1816182 RepID=A0A7W9IGT4_9ACTN|nr:hypothetical protein [Streptosporangium becharense]MBB2908852.1 hypothetical protein [Streptosporangium becharense]MBB5820130.1 hypothetical protein [Streptosporangium becharense]